MLRARPLDLWSCSEVDQGCLVVRLERGLEVVTSVSKLMPRLMVAVEELKSRLKLVLTLFKRLSVSVYWYGTCSQLQSRYGDRSMSVRPAGLTQGVNSKRCNAMAFTLPFNSLPSPSIAKLQEWLAENEITYHPGLVIESMAEQSGWTVSSQSFIHVGQHGPFSCVKSTCSKLDQWLPFQRLRSCRYGTLRYLTFPNGFLLRRHRPSFRLVWHFSSR